MSAGCEVKPSKARMARRRTSDRRPTLRVIALRIPDKEAA